MDFLISIVDETKTSSDKTQGFCKQEELMSDAQLADVKLQFRNEVDGALVQAELAAVRPITEICIS